MSEARDSNNIKFIQETLAETGIAGLTSWYNTQEPFVQEYVVKLLQTYAIEIQDLAQSLSGSVTEASSVLGKFRINKSKT